MTAAGRFRAHARRKVRLPGLLVSTRGGWRLDVEIADLALGGACVKLAETPAVGEAVTLAIIAPALWDPVSMSGKVAWVGPGPAGEAERAGIAFEPADARSALALFELMWGLE